MTENAILDEYEALGRLWFRNCLSDHTLSVLDAAADLDGKPGERLSPSELLRVAVSEDVGLGQKMSLFRQDLIPIRFVAFNKTAEANWAVPWHQDRVTPVAARHETVGFTNWTQKNDVWHCEPPVALLEQMLFVRVHLDQNAAEDGCMRLALGSHKLGSIPAADAKVTAERFPQEECVAKRGDVLVLKMLTLHASSSSLTTNQRRVLRIDFAPKTLLPAPLNWV